MLLTRMHNLSYIIILHVLLLEYTNFMHTFMHIITRKRSVSRLEKSFSVEETCILFEKTIVCLCGFILTISEKILNLGVLINLYFW